MGELPSMERRIAHILSCASSLTLPLRVCYPNVGKYHVNACKYVCKHTKKHHGHGMRAFACVVGAKSASWRSGVCDEIRPHRNLPILQIYPILQNSSMLQIRSHYNSPMLQFTHTTICLHHSLKIAGSGRRQRCYV